MALGGFNTNMPNALTIGKKPMDPDYKGTMAETLINVLSKGQFVPNGDKEKAMKAVYEVVVGEGVGKGHEAEVVLPLGRDIPARVKEATDKWAHTMEIFGEVCNNVYVEK